MSDTKKNISLNLKRLMNDHNINNSELSKKLGVSESTVGKWLLEKSIPRMGVIEQIASLFKVQKSEILESGYNVTLKGIKKSDLIKTETSSKEATLLYNYNKLNDLGKHKAEDYIEDLTRMDVYCNNETYNVVAAHNDNLNDKDNKDELDLIEEDLKDMDKW